MMQPILTNARTPETTAERLPECLPGVWSAFLLIGDAAVTAIAALLVGLPVHAIPALCLLVCGAVWFAGGGHISYAAEPRDELYQAAAAIILAALPVLVVLVGIGGFSVLQSIAVLPVAMVLLFGVHFGIRIMRLGNASVSPGLNDSVSPRAKRRVTSRGFRSFRRAVDTVIAGVGFVLLAPVMLAIAIVVARDSNGPIFFLQERVGRDRHRFVMYKFRTMEMGAGNAWVKPGDERVTRVGAFLRRTSLDEIPQLINVLRGEMSLVGPRPEMPEYAHEFRQTIPRYDDRSLVDPGITGWAQTHVARNLAPSDMAEVLPYDLFYVEHASLALDLYIAVKTLAEVAFHRAV